jgi:hypothetical protein
MLDSCSRQLLIGTGRADMIGNDVRIGSFKDDIDDDDDDDDRENMATAVEFSVSFRCITDGSMFTSGDVVSSSRNNRRTLNTYII